MRWPIFRFESEHVHLCLAFLDFFASLKNSGVFCPVVLMKPLTVHISLCPSLSRVETTPVFSFGKMFVGVFNGCLKIFSYWFKFRDSWSLVHLPDCGWEQEGAFVEFWLWIPSSILIVLGSWSKTTTFNPRKPFMFSPGKNSVYCRISIFLGHHCWLSGPLGTLLSLVWADSQGRIWLWVRGSAMENLKGRFT